MTAKIRNAGISFETLEKGNTAAAMSGDTNREAQDQQGKEADPREALAMLDAFAGVGATMFNVSLIDIDENPKGHDVVTLEQLRRSVAARLEAATRRKLNLIVHPRSKTALLVQLDDTHNSALWPHSFMRLETSPGNYQFWLAVSDGPKDGDSAAEKEAAKVFRYRMRRGAGADKFASGSVRLAGSLNIKPKYAPDFPVVRVSQVEPGRTTTVAALDAAGLIGPLPDIMAPGSVPPLKKPPPRAGGPRHYPDYQQALNGAPLKADGKPDRSLADFMYGKWMAQRGFTKEEIAWQIVQVSKKAQERVRRNPNDRYAQITAAKATEAALRGRGSRTQHLKSTADPH